MRRPSARVLKRSLLAAVCALAIASLSMRPESTRTTKHIGAAARTVPATVLARPTRSPRSAPSAQLRAVAARVARAHARYLANQLSARRLPAFTPQALATARNSGPLHPSLHITRVRLTNLTGGGDSWTAHYAISDTRGRQTTTAQLVLSATDGPWKLAELIPPDPDILMTPNQPALPPTGPAAARRAALAFTHSYLDYTYNHPVADQLRDLTPKLRVSIAANPPRVPANIRTLHPRIASLALTRDGARWLADANVTDGQNTYQITSLLARVRGDWLIRRAATRRISWPLPRRRPSAAKRPDQASASQNGERKRNKSAKHFRRPSRASAGTRSVRLLSMPRLACWPSATELTPSRHEPALGRLCDSATFARLHPNAIVAPAGSASSHAWQSDHAPSSRRTSARRRKQSSRRGRRGCPAQPRRRS